jgi:adenylate cyclase class 2
MYEVEVKVRADHDTVRSQLDELDATHTHTVHQADSYYDAPHRDFAETDEALRIREETNRDKTADEENESETLETTIHLTYKGPLIDDNSKTREESETVVESREMTADILDSLGFSTAAIVEKERERYTHGEYTVTLDTVSGLGEFVEVERLNSETEIETARDGAFSILRELGLDPDDQIRTSYLGLQIENNPK